MVSGYVTANTLVQLSLLLEHVAITAGETRAPRNDKGEGK
jgi:hypothetical protein